LMLAVKPAETGPRRLNSEGALNDSD